MEPNALEPLDWDEQEAATLPSIPRPPLRGSVRRSSKGWLVITNEWPAESELPPSGRDTIVNGPATERSAPPPPSVVPSPRTTPSPTHASLRRHEEVLELDAHELMLDHEPASPFGPSAVPHASAPPASAPPASALRRHSDIRALRAPSPPAIDPSSERETRQRPSVVPHELLAAWGREHLEPLEAQVAELRRWLMLALVLAAVATVSAAVAVVHALGGGLPRFELPSMDSTATMAVTPHVRPRVRTAVAGPSPSAGATSPERAIGDATEPAPADAVATVEVVVAVLGPRASVTLTEPGLPPKSLLGPWPMKLSLAPGRYTITAYRPGFPIFQRQLDLDPSRPHREVAISFGD